MLTDRLTQVRDETHQAFSSVIDALRAREHDMTDAVNSATAEREEARQVSARALADVAQVRREFEQAQREARASDAARAESESVCAAKIEEMRQTLAAVSPARLAAELNAKELRLQLSAGERRIVELERDLATTQDKLDAANLGREEAERHEGMYRRALYTYLQERDGPPGKNAPTPETLSWIRKLVETGEE